MIFVNDHEPAHVHATDGVNAAIYLLNCRNNSVSLDSSKGLTSSELRKMTAFLNENIGILCRAWMDIHG